MKKYFIIFFLMTIWVSCSNKLYVADSAFEKKYLSFIIDHKTSREEIILKLGEPSWVFEEGRIFTYRLSIDNKGQVKPVTISMNKNEKDFSYTNPSIIRHYSLVLVFTANHILEKHSLILTNP